MDRQDGTPPTESEVDAVMAAARVLVGISTASLLEVDDVVTLPQFRVLVVLTRLGPANLAALADALGVHPSSATRICDRLIAGGLLDRREDRADRRNVTLALTARGRRVVARVSARRRAAIRGVLERMTDEERERAAQGLRAFAAAGGEAEDARLWAASTTTWDG